MEPVPKRRPWDFQPGIDSSQSFAAFSIYLRERPQFRKLSIVARVSGCAYGSVCSWARSDLWELRARDYDTHINQTIQSEAERIAKIGAAQLAQQWLEPIMAAKAICIQELDKLQQESSERESRSLKPNEISRLLQVTHTAERLVLGQATEITEASIDLSKLSDEELDQYDSLVRKARKDLV